MRENTIDVSNNILIKLDSESNDFDIISNNTIVGSVKLVQNGGVLDLVNIFILEEYRRQGIGTKVIDILKSTKKIIWAEAPYDDEISKLFFQKMDFLYKESDIKPHYMQYFY